ncbi:MAG: Uma2 family endonuclease [Deltaproteobacteria bacterium]|nr:Uma2 family endonuclease [Deltaproteobacteria bacterium]MCB9785098.1 Uma2 family endonuclease [Deltaproteobacteria bacterium]
MSHALESRPKATYADIEALAPNLVGEILAGELHVSPRPAMPHAEAASLLGGLLTPPFRLGRGGPGGWRILDEPELSLGVDPDYDPVVPDLAGWRLESMPERLETAQVHTTPQWVCEVISPSSLRKDRFLKLPFYARAGVAHAWLVDPLNETLEVFALDGGTWRVAGLYQGDVTVHAPPFDAVGLCLTWLWGRTPPDATDEPAPTLDR